MKKLSRIITLILAICCITVLFTGCNNEHDKIIAEYAKLHGVDKSHVDFICVAEFDGTHVFLDYYGVHNQAISPESVDDVTFYHPIQIRFNVYNNGSFYGLNEAYANGLLTHDDLIKLRDVYNPK